MRSAEGATARASLECRGVTFGYPGRSGVVLRDVDLALEAGQTLALLGANGTGKSTLIGLMAGLLEPDSGIVHVTGRTTTSLPVPEMARLLTCVPQQHHPVFRFTVREVLLMGRSPHLGALGFTTAADLRMLDDVAERLQLAAMLDRPYTELSGGEVKRTILARALLQDTPILLLDEPDAHLDLPGRHRFMKIVREWMARGDRLVVFSTHDPDLALRYSTHCALFTGGGSVSLGETASIVTRENLEALYGLAVEELRDSAGERVLRFTA